MDFTTQDITLGQIVFDETIYPRKDHDPTVVQKYADCIQSIEDAGNHISVSSDMKLLDGKHRWLAYRKAFEDDLNRRVPVRVYEKAKSTSEMFAVAVELNSQHGYQLNTEDKKQCAMSMYAMGFTYGTIAEKLSVGKTRVSQWLSRTVKEAKDQRNRKIQDLWLACLSAQQIADSTGLTRQAVDKEVASYATTVLENQSCITRSNHAVDFEPPIYNVWKQQNKSNEVGHFGNTEARWLDNLLYLHTRPLDVVVDPLAGGGSTIDVCKKRFRRYFVSDRKPIVEREQEIRQHDIKDGPLKPPQWKDVRLVYLDPPYWKQAENRYSEDADDLANMDLEQFNNSLAGLIEAYARKISDAYIALIIQPTQWKSPDREYVDHVGDMLRAVKLPVEMRYSVPYESQQCTAQMVDWAKEHRRCLVLTREIIVWRVGQ